MKRAKRSGPNWPILFVVNLALSLSMIRVKANAQEAVFRGSVSRQMVSP